MNEMTVDDETGAEIVAGADADEPPILFLHDIDRQYRQGDVTLDILKGAELAIWPGQSVALVAPSGAGKSTLLHVAGLLEQPRVGVEAEQPGHGDHGNQERSDDRRARHPARHGPRQAPADRRIDEKSEERQEDDQPQHGPAPTT